MRLRGKVAIVTGAGNGIGKTTALLLASEGAKLTVTDIQEAKAKETAKEIKKHGGEALFLRHDISEEQEWQQVVQNTIDSYGKIDILFNNAGTFLIKPLIETEIEEWRHLMKVNVEGTFLGLKSVLPEMIKRKQGSIINNSSTAGLVGSNGVSLYGTSKGAIRSLTKHAAMEHAPDNVRINAVYPGFVDTDMMKYRGEKDKTDEQKQSEGVPLGRIGQTSEVANTVLFLASDESSYTTGAEFVIDGGRSAGKSY